MSRFTMTKTPHSAIAKRRQAIPETVEVASMTMCNQTITAPATAMLWMSQTRLVLQKVVASAHYSQGLRVVCGVPPTGVNCASVIVVSPSKSLCTLLMPLHFAGIVDNNMATAYITPGTLPPITDLVCCNIVSVLEQTRLNKNWVVKVTLNASLLHTEEQRDLARKAIAASQYVKTEIPDTFSRRMPSKDRATADHLKRLKTSMVLDHCLHKCATNLELGFNVGAILPDTLSREDEQCMENFAYHMKQIVARTGKPTLAFYAYHELQFENAWLYNQMWYSGVFTSTVKALKAEYPTLVYEIEEAKKEIEENMLRTYANNDELVQAVTHHQIWYGGLF